MKYEPVNSAGHLCAVHCAGDLPGRSAWMAPCLGASLRIDVFSDSGAIATGRTSEDSVARHVNRDNGMIRRRRVCCVKTPANGGFLGDANERARSLTSMMNTLPTAETGVLVPTLSFRCCLHHDAMHDVACTGWPAAASAAAFGPLGTPEPHRGRSTRSPAVAGPICVPLLAGLRGCCNAAVHIDKLGWAELIANSS